MLRKIFLALVLMGTIFMPASAICGVDEFVNITSPYNGKYLTYSANLHIMLDPTNPASTTPPGELYCNVTGVNSYFKKVNATIMNGGGFFGQQFYTANFDVDYDGNYTANCYMSDMNWPNPGSQLCTDQINFTVDRSQYSAQKGLVSLGVLIFIILFAALFTGIGMIVNSPPMRILMYMFGITAGLVGLNFAQVALREWVKVPSQTDIIMTFANASNTYWYFIMAVLLIMIIIWLHNSFFNKDEEDIEFMN